MKKLYEKNEMNFALVWIALYVVLFSVADSISASLGVAKIVTAPLTVLMAVVIYVWVQNNGLKEKYGLCKFQGDLKQYLYFIPLVLLASTNVWWGLKLNMSVLESILYAISMLCVGFLEEIIFRGFLFKAMCKDSLKWAIVVSSVTFGLGHIVNLLNGADPAGTLMQISYAIAIGFAFSILFYKGKSLWPCIIAHSMINCLSGFANRDAAPAWNGIAGSVFLIVISLVYAIYILNSTGKNNSTNVL